MRVVWCLIISFFVMNSVSFATSEPMSTQDAVKVINKHINPWYVGISMSEEYQKSNRNRYDKKINFLLTLKGLGLVAFTTEESEKSLIVTVKPAAKEEVVSPMSGKDEFGVVAGNREVEKIVKIDGENVYFSYWFIPNQVGKIFGFEKTKYRGKAKIKYDMFLEKYSYFDFYFSPWEREQWQKTTWLIFKDGNPYYSDETQY